MHRQGLTAVRDRGLLAATLVVAVGGSLLAAPVFAEARSKSRHDLSVSAMEIGGEGTNKFRIYGTVATFKGRKLTIQVKANHGEWEFWKKTPTGSDDGAFSERIYGGKAGSKVCYKVVVPSTKRHRTTKRRAACITTDPS